MVLPLMSTPLFQDYADAWGIATLATHRHSPQTEEMGKRSSWLDAERSPGAQPPGLVKRLGRMIEPPYCIVVVIAQRSQSGFGTCCFARFAALGRYGNRIAARLFCLIEALVRGFD